MATGDAYLNFVQKRLMGLVSWKDHFLEYLKDQIRYVFAVVWDKDGTFGSTKNSLGAGAANDQITVGTDYLGTDGSGHLLALDDEYFEDVPFENQTGNDYDVGVHYAERPIGVNPNPRTGRPEYNAWEEAWGIDQDPASVTDQGGGVIRLRLNDTMCPGDRTHAGRKCLVWMKIPAAGALTEAIAIEERTVEWSGSYNYIDTADSLGQSTISTTASDYRVLLLGPTIARNTDLDIEAAVDFWYIGEVTGNGPSATPTAFDITEQRLIEHSLSDVISYAGGPPWYDGTTNPATTIEAQLDKIVTDLVDDTGTSGPDASGAHKVGAAAQSGSPESLSVASIGAQLGQLLNWINTKGHIAVANVWTAMQTFSGAGTGAPIRLTKKSTVLAAEGEMGIGTAGPTQGIIRLETIDRIWAEEQRERKFLLPLTTGQPRSLGGSAEWEWNYGGFWQSDGVAGREYMQFNIDRFVPSGTTLVRARAFAVPGAARAFASRADRARIYLERKDEQNGALQILYSGFFAYPSGNNFMEVSGGCHDGGDNQGTLTDSLQAAGGNPGWTPGALVGRTVYNVTKGESATITANTATTISGTLSGGADWDNEDVYRISSLETVMDEAQQWQYYIGIWSGNYGPTPYDELHSVELTFREGVYTFPV